MRRNFVKSDRLLEPSKVPGHLSDAEGAWLAERARGGLVVEVGTYRGRSTCFMALQAQIVITCDPFSGQPATLPGQRRVDFAKVRHDWRRNTEACQVNDRIVLLEMRSSEAYPALAELAGLVDLVFIDGSHRADDLRVDVRFSNLLRVGGVIAFHDYSDPRFPDVRQMVAAWTSWCGNAFRPISAAGTIYAVEKLCHDPTPSDWIAGR